MLNAALTRHSLFLCYSVSSQGSDCWVHPSWRDKNISFQAY